MVHVLREAIRLCAVPESALTRLLCHESAAFLVEADPRNFPARLLLRLHARVY